MNTPENKRWFSPKRNGWGLRPQTWQGWLIIVAFVAIVLVLAEVFATLH